ncbi:MAG: FdhF/YdeP family oxidoreductase [Actinobacteria bacterium]|nr:FdhF/YdeP family oxidoreductase [Actinomycetota bacterium]
MAPRRWNPSSWVSLAPNGIGHTKPNHLAEMTRVAVNVRRSPKKAWKILNEGVCDGCALGVAGLHDWTLDGIHLCTTRLKLLEVNCAEPFDHGVLSDVTWLAKRTGTELREMGRLAHPMRRRRGEKGFVPIGWDEALDTIATAVKLAGGDRTAIYLTSRGLTNEVYYVAGKAARAMGVANIDSAARTCHAPSTVGLKATIGVAASTCSLQDVLETDLVVLWGANVANNQPVFTKYLYEAKKNGTKVVVINPYLEPGLERYWVPSKPESFLFGTKLCDLHVPVRPEGDVALANALLKRLIDRRAIDRHFIDEHTSGWSDLLTHLDSLDMDELLADAGVDVATLEALTKLYADARGAILIWSMGITQHRHGVEGVQAIVNVALARGNVGRDGAGLMPIRGHSGVQGGAEMGAYSTALPGGAAVNADNARALSDHWGFDVPSTPGLTAPEMVLAAECDDIDVLFLDGSNFLDVMPDPTRVAAALSRVPLRVHQDIVLTSQMFVEGDDVILLPAATRYEQEGGGTSTTTERRIAFGPQVVDPPGEARSEWRVFAELATRVRPDLSTAFDWIDNQRLRAEIARVVPMYAGIETLHAPHDAVQYGGRHLCANGDFPLPNGRAVFTAVDVRPSDLPDGSFLLSTRRGKQFNSMVFAERDPLTGAGRDAVYIDRRDATAIAVSHGDRVVLRSATGTMKGTAHVVDLPRRSLQVHWPEGNALIEATVNEDASRIPDYNAIVTIEKATP